MTITAGVKKEGTDFQEKIAAPQQLPTPWNHLEAGILFSLGRPLLVFREPGITGGVFDPGVTDVFVHQMPTTKAKKGELREVFLKWRSRVDMLYYGGSDK